MSYNQQRWMRDCLSGVGLTISGIFCLTVNPPAMGKFGVSLVMTGGGYMYNAIITCCSTRKKNRLAYESSLNFKIGQKNRFNASKERYV
jgi:hypothetical protein